jgi:hypothetical protein
LLKRIFHSRRVVFHEYAEEKGDLSEEMENTFCTPHPGGNARRPAYDKIMVPWLKLESCFS